MTRKARSREGDSIRSSESSAEPRSKIFDYLYAKMNLATY